MTYDNLRQALKAASIIDLSALVISVQIDGSLRDWLDGDNEALTVDEVRRLYARCLTLARSITDALEKDSRTAVYNRDVWACMP